MKVSITITGQITGNNILLAAIPTTGMESRNELPFNGYVLVFKTKALAVDALRAAFKDLISDKDDARNSNIRYSPGISLKYDASSAKITNLLNSDL